MRKIEYVVSNERLITPSGLSLVGQVLGKSDLIKKANRMRTEKRSQPQIKNGCVPVDIDVYPFDNSGSHKAGVSRTYKNFDGYAPIFAYIGTEGYLCNAELREGKQHCQSGTPEFLSETIATAKQMTKKPLLFRLDSGNDAIENMLLCDCV